MKIDLNNLAFYEEKLNKLGCQRTLELIFDTLGCYFLDLEFDPTALRPVFESLQQIGIVTDLEESFDSDDEPGS